MQMKIDIIPKVIHMNNSDVLECLLYLVIKYTRKYNNYETEIYKGKKVNRFEIFTHD